MTSLDYAKPNIDSVNGMLWRMFAYHNDELLSMIDQVVTTVKSNQNKTLIEKSVEKLITNLDSLSYAKISLSFKKVQDVIMTLDDLERNDPNRNIKEILFKSKKFYNPFQIKIKGFTSGEETIAKITNVLQPVFNQLANVLYSVSTAMYKMLSLTSAGVLKGTAISYLHLEYQMIAAIINLDQGPNFGTANAPRYHPRWELRKRAPISKASSLLNDAIVKTLIGGLTL
ncbi:hypothetical protein A9G43_05590 [Gilliamella sp. Occ3-1]|uniref:hypothetical protein n=1 Tax=Gilliamella sp. Occ3-1 TaxID=3120253 RepID=UPI00080ED882|nr:hypothetical protein [Gilliamella apicola]OCG71544.1 hypothetical protein A9G43_05590 [Gilliamella apicola]